MDTSTKSRASKVAMDSRGSRRSGLVARPVRSCCFDVTEVLGAILVVGVLTCGSAVPPAQGASANPADMASIEGAVTTMSAQGSQAVPGVTVELKGGDSKDSVSTSTDADGRYQFSKVAPGEYTLAVTVDGFKQFARAVSLRPGDAKVEGVTLELRG